MSLPQLLTIDFLGIGNHQTEFPQLNSAMDCHHQSLHSRSIQSSLGKIGVCEGIKTLDLFPQHPLGFQSNSKQDKIQSAILDTQIEISEAAKTNPGQSVSNSEESTERGKQSRTIQASYSKLPMAKKLSLQRFLQKRNDRLNKVIPYSK